MLGLAQTFDKASPWGVSKCGFEFRLGKGAEKDIRKGFWAEGNSTLQTYPEDDSCSEKGSGTISCWTRCCKGRCRTIRRFPCMLASIGVPLAIDVVKKILGKGLQTQPPRPRRLPRSPPPKGRGMQMRPPPFFRTWDNYKKK